MIISGLGELHLEVIKDRILTEFGVKVRLGKMRVTYRESIQEPSTLSDGSALELTVGTYFTPSGRSLDGVGIDPDVLVSAKAGSATAEQRALEVIRGLVAASDSTQRG